ncbi:3-isopropylmalate dehydratase small subunit [Bacillus sp. HMF5848]|uniref:3-isopropylmalate dehydratase small subunit n=1 Tax=Bacillus sp. HMF5848 TaxID=2495421 RepID=UPI000F778019|nr:3-isopropylmalate dehydratase small subunit [Bacillus sp. HMF5848]RSK28053.1 3-isopropylmalate dehydratase small subunit [Bacillus sp. HMF5848]
MQPFRKYKGKVAGLDRVNVDTDQIIPKQFLKRIERTGFGQFLFYDWRYKQEDVINEDFELNRPENAGSSILIANDNFGCGSSREHAPWALYDYGFKVVIAPSFADIFYSNCLKNGLLPIRLSKEAVNELLEKAKNADYELVVDLPQQTVQDEQGFSCTFEIDNYWKGMLVNGWDEIDVTLKYDAFINEYELQH